MPELTSEIEASQFQLIPNSIQNGHVTKVDDTGPDGQIKKTKSGLGFQISLDWTLDEGEFATREIRFDNMSLGGFYEDQKTKEKKPLNTSSLCVFLSKTGVPWECKSCNNGKAPRKFHIGTGDDGVTKGKYVCPDCKSPQGLKINYNTAEFMGARCGLSIGSQKKTTTADDGTKLVDPDKEFNVIKGYTDLRTY